MPRLELQPVSELRRKTALSGVFGTTAISGRPTTQDDAQMGELGVVMHKDGRTRSTELSIGVNFDGKERVIPLLVKGNEHIADAMRDGTFGPKTVTQEAAGIAVSRYQQRVNSGAIPAPGFDSIEEAEKFQNAKAGTIKRQK